MSEQGYGCMGLSAFYGSAASMTNEKAAEVVNHAIENGVEIFNTATFYGPLNENGYGHNLRLLNHVIHQPNFDRSKMMIMCKVGMDTRAPVEKTGQQWNILSDPVALRADIEYTLETLGVSCIDIAVLCRVPLDCSIEVPIALLAEMVKEGKIKHIGVSEASSENIRKAHAISPLYCIEQEWSLWARDIEEDIISTCKELGIAIVAYSPLGRGFLTGTLRSRADPAFGAFDFRLHMYPRMNETVFSQNLQLVDALKAICERKGITEGQLALAWLAEQGKRLGVRVIPIPGTSKIAHLDQNLEARTMALTDDEMSEINTIFTNDIDSKVGQRYAHMNNCFNAQVGKIEH